MKTPRKNGETRAKDALVEPYLNDTFKTGESSSYIYLKLVFFTNYNSIKRLGDSRKRGSK